jgi:hypothetical protein
VYPGLVVGHKERDKIMAENNASDRRQKFSQLWYESGQSVVQNTFDIQDRSVQYAQKSFADGMETLKSNIEASRGSMQPRENSSMDMQEGMQSRMESGVENYKRNIAFAQRVTEQGAETFRANAESIRDLTLTLMKKARERREIFF